MFKSLFGKKKPKRDAAPAIETIRDARVGDVFTVTGLELEFEDSYFIIENAQPVREPAIGVVRAAGRGW